jgi:SNF2 family DNA or RNA helicase
VEVGSTVTAPVLQHGSRPAVPDAYEPLLRRLADQRPVTTGASELIDQAANLWMRPGFDTFVSLSRLRFEPFAHQLQAAESVLRRMRGRAILADEVGLGKTIEAGLVISELRLRGLARRVLILVPAGLVDQWREELDRKFALPSAVLTRGGPLQTSSCPGEEPIVIASLASARRDPLQGEITSQRVRPPRAVPAQPVPPAVDRDAG